MTLPELRMYGNYTTPWMPVLSTMWRRSLLLTRMRRRTKGISFRPGLSQMAASRWRIPETTKRRITESNFLSAVDNNFIWSFRPIPVRRDAVSLRGLPAVSSVALLNLLTLSRTGSYSLRGPNIVPQWTCADRQSFAFRWLFWGREVKSPERRYADQARQSKDRE